MFTLCPPDINDEFSQAFCFHVILWTQMEGKNKEDQVLPVWLYYSVCELWDNILRPFAIHLPILSRFDPEIAGDQVKSGQDAVECCIAALPEHEVNKKYIYNTTLKHTSVRIA